LMKEKKLSGLPVVDKDGRVTGCISSDDIKQLGFDLRFFKLLGFSIKDYLESLRTRSLDKVEPYAVEPAVPRPNVISVQPSQTLSKVLRLATFYEVHRVFVTEPQGKLIGVITLRDFLEAIFDTNRT